MAMNPQDRGSHQNVTITTTRYRIMQIHRDMGEISQVYVYESGPVISVPICFKVQGGTQVIS